MNRRPLLFAMIVSLIISYFMYKNLMEKQKQVKTDDLQSMEALLPKIPTVSVVTARNRIPAKTRLEDPYIREALELKDINASSVPTDAFTSIASITGRYTGITILPGDILTPERLLDKKLVPNLSFAIPEGKRAYTVLVDKVRGVAGFVQQGDIVDIVGFFRPSGQMADPVSRIVLQDLPVLAVGQTYEFDSALATSAPTINANKFDLVTLAVDPVYIEYLSLLVNNNTPFQLVLKNPNDKGKQSETKGATEKIVLTAVGLLPPPGQPAPAEKPTPEPGTEPVQPVQPDQATFVLPAQPPAEPEKIEISYGSQKREQYKDGLEVTKPVAEPKEPAGETGQQVPTTPGEGSPEPSSSASGEDIE